MKKFLQTHPPITEAIRFFYTLFAQHLSTPTWVLLREVPMFLLFLKVQATKPWWVAHLLLFSSPLLGAFEVMLNLRNKKREGESFFFKCLSSISRAGWVRLLQFVFHRLKTKGWNYFYYFSHISSDSSPPFLFSDFMQFSYTYPPFLFFCLQKVFYSNINLF
jgi:hypothetical protein